MHPCSHLIPSGTHRPSILILLGAILILISTTDYLLMAESPLPLTPVSVEQERVPELQIPHSASAWNKQRIRIRKTLHHLLGDFPTRPKVPQVHITHRWEKEGYIQERFEFQNGLGMTVPGYILIPSSKAVGTRSPAILYCHWHAGQYAVGKEELFQTNAVPEAPGPALVKQGYVVLAIDAACFGERQGQGPHGAPDTSGAGEATASKYQLWRGRSLWGVMVRDDLMALDYLCSRPEVDASRIGVTGISMGSTRSWWLMGLDDRPRVMVGVGCLTRYQDLIESQGLKYHGIYYFVPGMLRHFDSEAVVALVAPRPALFMTGADDAGSPTSGIHKLEAAVRPAYALWKAEEQFRNIVYPGIGHVYTPEMWKETQNWLAQHLQSPQQPGKVRGPSRF